MLATVVLVHVVAIGHVKVSTVYGIYSSIHPGYPKVNYRKLILYMWPHIVCNSVVVHTVVHLHVLNIFTMWWYMCTVHTCVHTNTHTHTFFLSGLIASINAVLSFCVSN